MSPEQRQAYLSATERTLAASAGHLTIQDGLIAHPGSCADRACHQSVLDGWLRFYRVSLGLEADR